MRVVRRDESGAVAVEAALLLPLITLIILGIVEFGLLFRDVLTVQTAARDAARTGSAHSREPDFATLAVDRVKTSMSIRSPEASDKILVYKAEGSNGLPAGATSATNALTNCNTNCSVYTWNAAANNYTTSSADPWLSTEQNACPEDAREYLGIIVAIEHPFITGQIGDIMTGGADGKKTVLEKVVMRLEPRPAGDTDCKPIP